MIKTAFFQKELKMKALKCDKKIEKTGFMPVLLSWFKSTKSAGKEVYGQDGLDH